MAQLVSALLKAHYSGWPRRRLLRIELDRASRTIRGTRERRTHIHDPACPERPRVCPSHHRTFLTSAPLRTLNVCRVFTTCVAILPGLRFGDVPNDARTLTTLPVFAIVLLYAAFATTHAP
jgi:hypothetical protein